MDIRAVREIYPCLKNARPANDSREIEEQPHKQRLKQAQLHLRQCMSIDRNTDRVSTRVTAETSETKSP